MQRAKNGALCSNQCLQEETFATKINSGPNSIISAIASRAANAVLAASPSPKEEEKEEKEEEGSLNLDGTPTTPPTLTPPTAQIPTVDADDDADDHVAADDVNAAVVDVSPCSTIPGTVPGNVALPPPPPPPPLVTGE